MEMPVVLYLSSTSNHNPIKLWTNVMLLCYIFLLHQTTTLKPALYIIVELCYIFLLHQTTTKQLISNWIIGCVISFFYIKPQPGTVGQTRKGSCVISFFYIKPQPRYAEYKFNLVVLYLSSTSNHNQYFLIIFVLPLCYIFLLHQTTTVMLSTSLIFRCVISFFYIKPQPRTLIEAKETVVLYLSSTSNHNN